MPTLGAAATAEGAWALAEALGIREHARVETAYDDPVRGECYDPAAAERIDQLLLPTFAPALRVAA